ncbi:arginase family protein [Chitinophaga japonensis]|uniref:Arginase n=1 Tax=Chitinophaga japonensis TaxID=104662 RepID=A0A562SMN1_CHIJA|nr:arginase family protein [Chitinophaga japonensis]TWI82551.1 arginase [Chitinophaga japonensis]
MPPFNPIHILSAPSVLGLKPNGVEQLPAALQNAGLLPDVFAAPGHHTVIPTLNHLYNAERDPHTQLLNGRQIAAFSRSLADSMQPVLQAQQFALVLGGDCSVLIGAMLSLKQRGRYGLAFIDAHADFYQPAASPTGEVADMDLAIVSGRGPDLLTNISGCRPYVRDSDIMQIGQRDMAEAAAYGSQDIRDTGIRRFDIDFIRTNGMAAAVAQTVAYLETAPLEGYWIHFDADVLADDIMPAVEYHLPGGLSLEEAKLAISTLARHPKACGMTVTIYNPALDEQGKAGKKLVSCLNDCLNKLI